MNQSGCISATVAAKIISSFGMSTSVLMMNILMGDFLSRQEDEEFLTSVETWTLLGLNWTKLIKLAEIRKQVQLMLICFLGYSVLYLLASAFLAVATIFRIPKLALPWLYIQMVSIIDQISAVCVRLGDHHRYVHHKADLHMPLSSIYLVVSVYFWMIVYSARQDWLMSVRNSYGVYNLELGSSEPNDANVPKTPSFLAQNLSVFESPQPHIHVKYDVV